MDAALLTAPKLAPEPKVTPVEAIFPDRNSVADRDGRVAEAEGRRGTADSGEAATPAYRIEISEEASRLTDASPIEPAGADTPDPEVADPNAAEPANDPPETNQVTSFEQERTGNDTRNETEAGRTLGQVIDAFA